MKYKFREFNNEAIEYIYQKCIVEQWSLSYAVSEVSGKMDAFLKAKKTNPTLQAIYEMYMERSKFLHKTKRVNYGEH